MRSDPPIPRFKSSAVAGATTRDCQRRIWLARKLASFGLSPPTPLHPLWPLRCDVIHHGRPITFLARPTTPRFGRLV